MRSIVLALARHAAERPEAACLVGADGVLTRAQTLRAVDMLAPRLAGRRVALLLDNGTAWALLDIAALAAGSSCVPLPAFFADDQLRHAIADAGVDLLVGDDPERMARILPGGVDGTLAVAGRGLATRESRHPVAARAGSRAARITYTSGTTGTPKGVALSARALETVATSMVTATGAHAGDRALSLLPLSLLLQNIGGIHAPLLAGATCVLPPLGDTGMNGAAGLDPARLVAAVTRHAPTSIILVPQMLRVLVEAMETGWQAPATLRFAAVGGAAVSPALLARASRLGLPVHEGYGLSEAASVVTLNRPGAHRPGSVGRPLPHARVRISADGEVEVAGALMDGYVGDAPRGDDPWWPTGDLGHLDDDGYLHLHGRRRDVFITAFGRNVSPEWVEGELLAEPALVQAFVHGEAEADNVALLVPRPGADAAAVSAAVAAANHRLPDYARVARFALLDQPFTPDAGTLTGNGRPRRRAIETLHASRLAALHATPDTPLETFA